MRFIPIITLALAACAAAQQLNQGETCPTNKQCETRCGSGEYQVVSDDAGVHFSCTNDNKANQPIHMCAKCTLEIDAVRLDRFYDKELARACDSGNSASGKILKCVTSRKEDFEGACRAATDHKGRSVGGKAEFSEPTTLEAARQACSAA
ncbi:hypothetical protein AJ80_04784 [Polytolypa hystricis UAMH7299]|uniref:Cyanovirin-N domain-containing protein n=1 Tax=Polytolypa hystricis (strain UAMH7299) TaxID=1447883 RepID=A0A2B7Y035_POLH7|nr:hypothetical protein AJ80_04784 [Polytolypa hystricis UAMH7299]